MRQGLTLLIAANWFFGNDVAAESVRARIGSIPEENVFDEREI